MKDDFWNLVAKYGAILGAILALSGVVEVMMVAAGYFGTYILELIAVFAIHLYLLNRFTKQYSNSFSKDEGFTFGKGYGFVVLISLFAGIVVGFVNYIYIHLVVGYENHIANTIASMESMLSQIEGGVPSFIEPIFHQTVEQLQNMPEPSIIATVWGGAFSGIIFGAIYGLIIAGINSRAAKPFEDSTINN